MLKIAVLRKWTENQVLRTECFCAALVFLTALNLRGVDFGGAGKAMGRQKDLPLFSSFGPFVNSLSSANDGNRDCRVIEEENDSVFWFSAKVVRSFPS